MPQPDPKKPPASSANISRILRLARPEWRRIALGIVFLLIGAGGTQILFPLGLKRLIDAAQAGRAAEVDRTALALMALVVVGSLGMGLRALCFSVAGERAVTRLRQDLYRAILSQELAFFDERRTGELMSRLSSDTGTLQSAVSANISMLLRNLAVSLGGLGMLLYLSPTLTLLMLAVVPPVALGVRSYSRKVRDLARNVQDALARASEVTEETISGLRTVRAFAAEPREVQRYAREVDRSYELAVKRSTMVSIFMGGASMAALCACNAVLWYGARMILRGSLSVGELTSFLIYTLQLAMALGSLSELWADFMKASGAADRVFELLDRGPAMPLAGGLRPERVLGEVRFEGVTFSYPTRKDIPVLKGMDLVLRQGEVVAMVGHSGAGKSTIASLLSRLYDPNGGRILLDGQSLQELDPSWLRQQIGIVAQEPILFSCSIAENIRYGRPDATDAEVEAAARTANAHDFITRFPEGYQTLVGERGVQLSGGQKQRVAIARALLKDPRILILDEATSALDAESEHLVKEALDRLMKGRTTLIIAHRLSTVMDAHRVLVLDGGVVVQSGNHQALMGQDGLYRRLVEHQLAAA